MAGSQQRPTRDWARMSPFDGDPRDRTRRGADTQDRPPDGAERRARDEHGDRTDAFVRESIRDRYYG